MLVFVYSFLVGTTQCPIHPCTMIFTDYTSYVHHLRMNHGAKHLPWTCSKCYQGDGPHAVCFMTEKGFMLHWRRMHPDVATAAEIVHPTYGSHYSFLHVQELVAEDLNGQEEEEDVDEVWV